MLVGDEDDALSPVMLLTEKDYPVLYRTSPKRFAHPQDYEISDAPIEAEIFYFSQRGHNRLLARLPFHIPNNKYSSATFVLDTGAPAHLYLNDTVVSLLGNRVETDDAGTNFIRVDTHAGNRRFVIKDVPTNHLPANIIGLPALLRMGFRLTGDDNDINAAGMSFNAVGLDQKIL
ncbi:hypothetical protein HK097_010324 [Rhizophlyctis rosea]|uniref:Uncharacterized protein n=1 Tax=Rhizophlyctis rosea TaxID=64517 RepID=A0AAD5X382_9FUNG|nr:hypothetical protein HK097_010324 [Rhizophlyctis rosea]